VVTTAVLVNGSEVDPARVLRPVSVTHGRSRSDVQAEAPTVEMFIEGEGQPARAGDVMEVWSQITGRRAAWDDPETQWDDEAAAWDGAIPRGVQRFSGRVGAVRAVGELGRVVGWQVQAVGGLAGLGFSPVILDRPEETETARVAAIAAAADVTIDIRGSSHVTLAADTIDRDALDALHQICESSGALLWQTPTGLITFGTADHRDTGPTAALPPAMFLDGVSWESDPTQIVNHVTAFWGPEDSQQQVTHRLDSSIDRFGLRHRDVRTVTAGESDAEQLALLVLARRAEPFWQLADLMVNLDSLGEADMRAVMSLDMGTVVTVPVPPEPGLPFPGPMRAAVVEGWVETWAADGTHALQVAVSDPARWGSGSVRTWGEMAAHPWSRWVGGSWLQLLAGGGGVRGRH
jgi:hypothetical protein